MIKDATKTIRRTSEGKKEEMVEFDNHMTLSEGRLKNVPVQIENVIVPIDFKVIDSGSQEILIGMDWMRKSKAKFDAEKMELKVQ